MMINRYHQKSTLIFPSKFACVYITFISHEVNKGKFSVTNDNVLHFLIFVRFCEKPLIKRLFDVDVAHCPNCGEGNESEGNENVFARAPSQSSVMINKYFECIYMSYAIELRFHMVLI